MALVEIAVARQHCRAEPDDDAVLAVYLAAAEQHACDFLNRQVFQSQEHLDQAIENGTGGAAPILVNAAIRSAILLLCGHLYAHREDVVEGGTVQQVPTGALELLRPHRLYPGVAA